ncbi:MAG TPA: CocE/NonD family hydrolase [Conexibacter sp.]
MPDGERADGVHVAFDVPARMRDGTVLRANVYRPDGDGPWPVLLKRTPYSKDDHHGAVWEGLDPLEASRRGFMVVVQDVRGRFASDGVFEAYRWEREDGYDTVEWAARLPGANGRVGMYSGSYCGNTQWLAAADAPPSLAAISPALTWSDPTDGLLSRGGAVELGLALRWALENGWDTLGRLGLDEAERLRRTVGVVREWDRIVEDGYRELPLGAAAERWGLPDLGGLAAIGRSEVADRCRVTDLYERVRVPSLHTAGWYDIFAQGTLDNFAAMAAAGRDARLIVGPWSHHLFRDPVGELCFGLDSWRDGAPLSGDWGDLQLTWLRSHLAPGARVELPERPVRIFVMGRNAWREESGWPLARAREQRWFLHADGSLAATAPDADAPPSAFAHDPADPVPTTGGNGELTPAFPNGPAAQGAVEARPDVLVFTSEPLQHELEVTGRVRVVLHGHGSAAAADWVARLCDVHPDGRSYNVCDGIVRIAEGADELRRIEIDLWSTSNAFLPGHRLRVHVAGSSFPRWDRNLAPGRQHVHHAAEWPSWIELPVVG